MRNLLCNLRLTDTFNVQLFASSSIIFSSASLEAYEQNIEAAMRFLSKGQGGGGTQLPSALIEAYKLPRKEAIKVDASSFFNVFGGKFAPHYLAEPYFNFVPIAESQGAAALTIEFKELYNKTDIVWRSAIQNSIDKTYSPFPKTSKRNRSLEISFLVKLNFKLERIILGFGEATEVIKPDGLRKRMTFKAKSIARLYGED